MITDRQSTAEEGCRVIAALLLDCQKVLDLGCGKRHHTKDLPLTVAVDIDPNHAIDPHVLVMDVREAPTAFRRMHFDAALMTDVLEHFPKEDGIKMLKQLEPMSDRLIIFTPLGEMWVDVNKEPESPHHHRCGYLPFELQALGYVVWVWPRLHNFSGEQFGAFYAWKWMHGKTPTPQEIADLAGVPV